MLNFPIVVLLLLFTASTFAFISTNKTKPAKEVKQIQPVEQIESDKNVTSSPKPTKTSNKPSTTPRPTDTLHDQPGNPSAGISTIPIQITQTKTGIRLEIDENALTQAANQTLLGVSLGSTPLGEAKIYDIKVLLQSGVVGISGNAEVGFVKVPIEATAKVGLSDGVPRVNVENTQVGGITMPNLVNDQLEGPIQSQIDSLLSGQNIDITSLTIDSGKLIILGNQK